MNLIELYQSYRADGEAGKSARELLNQTHWFSVNAEFDPMTGEALPQALSVFLARVADSKLSGKLQDRLYRITEHARPAVERLFRALNESPRREYALLPVRSVRELDAGSFCKLSMRPGRNIREKLAGKPYLYAVRRFLSVNLPENRLLKAFVTRLAELLEVRRACLGEAEDELLPRIQSWLLSEESNAIGAWDNLPPNNTLLSHRDYRRVWAAWRRLQTLDDDIAHDQSLLDVRRDTKRRWIDYGRMYREGTYLFADMPVLFDYEEFTIRTWGPEPMVKKNARRINRSFSERVVAKPACIDLASIHPRFASTANESLVLMEYYLWQQWNNDEKAVDIALFNSDAAYFHLDATCIASQDLLFASDQTPDHVDRAARTFAVKLRSTFRNDKLIWLIPDFRNDFELAIIRRNLNARFPDAEPLPRSVAAVFEQVDYSRIKNDGYPIVVVDTIGDITCVTKLLARFDQELLKRIPETKGYYWERCPPVILPSRDAKVTTEKSLRYDMITVDANGQWRDSVRQGQLQFYDQQTLKNYPQIGQFAFCISVAEGPVLGGIRLHSLQQLAGDIPLWRDRVPELSIKVFNKDGYYQRIDLVSRGTTVTPIRGVSVSIPVEDTFTLPAGKYYYLFPLFQGENANEIDFRARLDSPVFPLKHDAICKLNLMFAYGEDEPYTLTFEPIDGSFPTIRASWRRIEEVISNDAPAPEYPKPLSWATLLVWIDSHGQQIDLLEWLIDSLTRLNEQIPCHSVLTIESPRRGSPWKRKTDNSGKAYWYAFAATDHGECYCNSSNIIDPVGEDPNDDFPRGTQLFGYLRKTSSGLSAFDMSLTKKFAPSNETLQRLVSFKERSLQNRMSLIWADNRSLDDTEVPFDFKQQFNELMSLLSHRLPKHVISLKMFFLLACLHKDTTDDCVQWITDQVESGNIRDPRAVGFALGDISQEWQQSIFRKLVSNPGTLAISVFAYAIWREQSFVFQFSIKELKALLNSISHRLAIIRPIKIGVDRKGDKRAIRNWVRTTAEPLELLLGLLRTRASKNPDIKMILQPHQKITKELTKQVERVTEIVAQLHVNLFSRVQLANLPEKPVGDRTPDLLFALRLYLSGDDGANAIHITSISDNDNE